MKIYPFVITLRSPLLIPSKAVSEGEVDSLDYLPGNLFLGLVASQYKYYSDPFVFFHSGKIRFNDACILIDGMPTLKAPLSWSKKTNGEYFNALTDNNRPSKAKQVRTSYVTSNQQLYDIPKHFMLKSAFDSKLRRSKDEKMYGYEVIESGSQWYFELHADDDVDTSDIDRAISFLNGNHRLGKSRNAEFGAVTIVTSDLRRHPLAERASDGTAYIYAKSDLILDDSPLPADFAKSHIRTRRYTPYNGIRSHRDSERQCILKGSVIALTISIEEACATYSQGLGLYRSEGFGEVLINPRLLFVNPVTSAATVARLSRRIQKPSMLAEWVLLRHSSDQVQKAAAEKARETAVYIQSSALSRSQINTLRQFIRMTDTFESFLAVFHQFANADQRKEKWSKILQHVESAPANEFKIYIETLAKELAAKV